MIMIFSAVVATGLCAMLALFAIRRRRRNARRDYRRTERRKNIGLLRAWDSIYLRRKTKQLTYNPLPRSDSAN